MILTISQLIVLVAGVALSEPSHALSVQDKENRKQDLVKLKQEFDHLRSSLGKLGTEQTEVEDKSEKNLKRTVRKEPAVIKIKRQALTPLVSTGQNESVTDTTRLSGDSNKPVYIKYDNKGTEIAEESELWACVKDTRTGLMWEVKAHDGAMQDSTNLYSWYDPDNTAAQGKSDGGRCTGDSECDTHDYVEVMNERQFCGYSDWQIPTREQMQTLVELNSDDDQATINKQYFPNTIPSWYWTSSDTPGQSSFAWYVLFRNGIALSDLKERPKHIRLVRNTTMSSDDS